MSVVRRCVVSKKTVESKVACRKDLKLLHMEELEYWERIAKTTRGCNAQGGRGDDARARPEIAKEVREPENQ